MADQFSGFFYSFLARLSQAMPRVVLVLVFSVVCSCCLVGVHAANSVNFCQVKCPFNIILCERYMTDSRGCPTCQCLCYSFRLICPKYCSSGTEYVKDENGCTYCRCACSKQCLQPCGQGNQMETNQCTKCQCK